MISTIQRNLSEPAGHPESSLVPCPSLQQWEVLGAESIPLLNFVPLMYRDISTSISLPPLLYMISDSVTLFSAIHGGGYTL